MNLFSILLSICVYCITIIVTKIITRINDIREKGRYINAFQNTLSHRYYRENELNYQRKSAFEKISKSSTHVFPCYRMHTCGENLEEEEKNVHNYPLSLQANDR